MLRQTTQLCSVLALMGCAGLGAAPLPAAAADTPNVMVAADDSDRDAVPRESQVLDAVLDAIGDQFRAEGYDVYDETLVTGEWAEQGREGRDLDELRRVVRAIDNPIIDVLGVFTLYVTVDEADFANFARVRVKAQAFDIHGSRVLANYSVQTPDTYRFPKDCTRPCVIDELVEKATEIGRDVGYGLTQTVLGEWRTSHGGSTTTSGDGDQVVVVYPEDETGFTREYEIKYQNFDDDARLAFEEHMAAWDCFLELEPYAAGNLHGFYRYKSCDEPIALQRNIVRMLKRMDQAAEVRRGTNSFEVTRIARRATSPAP